MSLLAALSILVAVPAGITLDIRSPQRSVLVGEPVKLVVTWRATKAGTERIFPENEDFTNWSLHFLVSDGATERRYREMPRSLDDRIEPIVKLSAGGEAVRTLVLAQGLPSEGSPLLFEVKGQYKLRAVYAKFKHWVESNTLSFTVTEPEAEDRKVLEAARADPALLRLGGDAQSQARTKALIANHPGSPYLRWAKLRVLDEEGMAFHNGYDPSTGESLWHLDKVTLRERRLQGYRELGERILEEADWGAFEEDALALAHRYGQASGDVALTQKARDQLLKKYPRSAVVKRIKEDEADDDEDDEDDDQPPAKPSPKPKQ